MSIDTVIVGNPDSLILPDNTPKLVYGSSVSTVQFGYATASPNTKTIFANDVSVPNIEDFRLDLGSLVSDPANIFKVGNVMDLSGIGNIEISIKAEFTNFGISTELILGIYSFTLQDYVSKQTRTINPGLDTITKFSLGTSAIINLSLRELQNEDFGIIAMIQGPNESATVQTQNVSYIIYD